MKQATATRKITTMALLTALALALSWMERMIPLELLIPLPGVKLGLANIVTLFALYMLDLPSALLILLTRCLMTAFFSGSVTGLAFSLTGGTLSLFTMALCMRLPFLSVFGVSIAGAAMHNLGQIMVAMLLMHTSSLLLYLAYLLIISVVCGLATGAASSGVIRAMGKLMHKH